MSRSLDLIIFSLAFLAFSFLLPGMSLAQQQEPLLEVLTAASEGLPSFLRAIPSSELAHFNFISPQELELVSLGIPFQVHTIDPQDILEYDGRSSVTGLVRPTDIWLVPVLAQGRIRTLLTVDKVDGEWKAVAIGSSNLAKEWEALGKSYPFENGYGMTFVRVYQAVSDFVLLDQPSQEAAMIPMRSASTVLGMPQSMTHAPGNVIESLREPVRMNLELDGAYQ